jgi:hypothetical protein
MAQLSATLREAAPVCVDAGRGSEDDRKLRDPGGFLITIGEGRRQNSRSWVDYPGCSILRPCDHPVQRWRIRRARHVTAEIRLDVVPRSLEPLVVVARNTSRSR